MGTAQEGTAGPALAAQPARTRGDLTRGADGHRALQGAVRAVGGGHETNLRGRCVAPVFRVCQGRDEVLNLETSRCA